MKFRQFLTILLVLCLSINDELCTVTYFANEYAIKEFFSLSDLKFNFAISLYCFGLTIGYVLWTLLYNLISECISLILGQILVIILTIQMFVFPTALGLMLCKFLQGVVIAGFDINIQMYLQKRYNVRADHILTKVAFVKIAVEAFVPQIVNILFMFCRNVKFVHITVLILAISFFVLFQLLVLINTLMYLNQTKFVSSVSLSVAIRKMYADIVYVKNHSIAGFVTPKLYLCGICEGMVTITPIFLEGILTNIKIRNDYLYNISLTLISVSLLLFLFYFEKYNSKQVVANYQFFSNSILIFGMIVAPINWIIALTCSVEVYYISVLAWLIIYNILSYKTEIYSTTVLQEYFHEHQPIVIMLIGVIEMICSTLMSCCVNLFKLTAVNISIFLCILFSVIYALINLHFNKKILHRQSHDIQLV